jgi:hypothetical protein
MLNPYYPDSALNLPVKPTKPQRLNWCIITVIAGYALIVDGQLKTEFKSKDHALKAATDLKGRFPMLQVKVV